MRWNTSTSRRAASKLHALISAGWILLLLLPMGRAIAEAPSPVSREYQIKAAFLYNFIKFVEWPASTFSESSHPLVVGVFGRNPFGSELGQIAKDHNISGRPILVKTIHSLEEAEKVHVLFVSASEDSQANALIKKLGAKAVLTVGESDRFLSAGGMITFVREGDKVRFEVNHESASQAGLKISAQLLKLAKAVRNSR